MSRQHAGPVFVPKDGAAQVLQPLGLGAAGHGWDEAVIQALVQEHPACLPIAEIDPLFSNPIPICTELNTTAGPIDNLLVTASGLPVIVECKLWRNPQARREVVGQILDYAKELSRWSCSDLQREVRRRLGRGGDPILEIVRSAGHEVDEIAFNDALTLNLRRGRFLLLIIGDGIREGVEAIAEYLQAHAGLHFTLGLVELPIFSLPDGGRIVAPRIVARTQLVSRTVIALPNGFGLDDDADGTTTADQESDPEIAAWSDERQQFWSEFQAELRLDDPEQVVGKPPRMGYTTLTLPAPNMACWLTIYRDMSKAEVGVFLSYTSGSVGERVAEVLANDPQILPGTWRDRARDGEQGPP